MKTKLIMVVAAWVGFLDAGFITFQHLLGLVPPCLQGLACEKVLTSNWASIELPFVGFNLPVSALGMVYYGLGLLAACSYFVSNSRKIQLLSLFSLLVLSSGGFLFTLYLITLMAFVIKAWCLYCLVSALSTTVLLSVSWLEGFKNKTPLLGFVYTKLCKPLLFQLPADSVHEGFTKVGSFLGKWEWSRNLTALVLNENNNKKNKLHSPIVIDGISFPNRVGLAAGFDYNGHLLSILPSVGFGFSTVGSVTLHKYAGNPKPNLGRFPSSKALLVNKGLKNDGIKAILNRLNGYTSLIPFGLSIASTNKKYSSDKEQVRDIIESFRLAEAARLFVSHSFYELNISCPNTFGGEPFTTPRRLTSLLAALDKLKLRKPIYVKLPIDLSKNDILNLLAICNTHRIAGVICGNLTKDHNNPDVTAKDKKLWQNSKGNLSGKPTWQRSNNLIALVKKNYGKRFTIIGTGGIFSVKDAQEKIKLGADLVQVITGMVYQGPQLISQLAGATMPNAFQKK